MDKGDLGTIVGGGLSGIAAITAGLSPVLVVAATVGGAYIGHELANPSHYAPKY